MDLSSFRLLASGGIQNRTCSRRSYGRHQTFEKKSAPFEKKSAPELEKKIFLCYNKKTICNPNFSLLESAGKTDAFSGKDKSLSHPMYEREGATYGKTYRTAMLFVR